MKYDNAYYAVYILHYLGIPVSAELGDTKLSFAYGGYDNNNESYVAKVQREQNCDNLKYIGFAVDSCYYNDITAELLNQGFKKFPQDIINNIVNDSTTKQEIYTTPSKLCIVQIGNSYLVNRIYLYFAFRDNKGTPIVKSSNDVIVKDYNTIFDPQGISETDWNYTEIDPDWLKDVGIYFDEETNEDLQLRPFYDARTAAHPSFGFNPNPSLNKRNIIISTKPITQIDSTIDVILNYINKHASTNYE
jgi:hypothetical protein